MSSILYELQRTLATMTLLPWTVVRSPSGSPATSPALQPNRLGQHESMRWVFIQIFVVYAFYRLITPLLTTGKFRAYSKARTVMDVWLFFALAIHTPELNENFNTRPTRLFASVFALFLVASHVALAVFTFIWHVVGWITRTFWPNLVDILWLPSGKTWKSPSLGNQIRFSLVLSLATSLVFVGCTMEAQQAGDNLDALPLICKGSWYSRTANWNEIDETTIIHRSMGFLGQLGKLSLLHSPVGLLWLSGLALFVTSYITQRSTRLSVRARVSAAMGLQDVRSRADALWKAAIEDGVTASTKKLVGKAKPEFLEMCEWYSVATVDTAVQLLISLKLFLGRFDVRLLKRPQFGTYARVALTSACRQYHNSLAASLASLRDGSSRGPETEDDLDLYFDWMADTGDGGDSTYQVARCLARPKLYVRKDESCIQLLKNNPKLRNDFKDLELPRGRLLLIGGDLAYPDPSIENLDRRLFQPFCDAMEPPPSYTKDAISIGKDESNPDRKQKDQVIPMNGSASAPAIFCLAGNHDHFDGLNAFVRCILDRDWLGGWRLPQTSSYFSIKLTHGWWIFALDQGLGEDIDSTQFRYFEHMANHVLGKDDHVIVCSHEPIFVYDAYCEKYASDQEAGYKARSPFAKELLRNHLKDKVALRIFGDLHNYQRYEEADLSKPEDERLNLVISGGGGAFLHPTHHFPERLKEDDRPFKRVGCYPDVKASRRLGFENLGSGFRVHNWRFDFVGASLYYLLCLSLFPRCGVKARVMDASVAGVGSYLENYFFELVSMVHDAFKYGIVSPITMICVMLITIGFADGEKGVGFSLRLGIAHGLAHIVVALTAFMLLQITVEVAISDGLAGSSFYSLFESYLETERGAVPQPAWTDASFYGIIREILRGFDMPESVAVPHATWCRGALMGAVNSNVSVPLGKMGTSSEGLSRYDVIWFYFASYAYMYVLSCDLVALVIGIYLAVSSSVFFVHWNESFSSLRHRHLKNFIRFKIDKQTGDLHAFVLGIDRVPKHWMPNPNYRTTAQRMKEQRVHGNELDPKVASFGASHPNKWLPANQKDAMMSKPRLIDYFIVSKRRSSNGTSSSTSFRPPGVERSKSSERLASLVAAKENLGGGVGKANKS